MKKTEQERIDTHSDICKTSQIMAKHLIYVNSNMDACTKFQESIGHEKVKSAKAGLKDGETRATFIVNENLIEKIKAIAYWYRVPLKIVMDDVLKLFIDSYEKRNGLIKKVE